MTENNKSEQNEGDGDLCDYWNDRTEDCVQNEMMSGHKTENWVQNELTDGHTSWNNRIWHRNWIQSKLTGGHNIWSRYWQGDRVRNKLTSHSIESVGARRGSQIRQKVQTNRVWNRHGSVQDSGAGKAASNTRVQMSLGRGSWSTVLDDWQDCCVGRGSTFACVQRYRRQLMTSESRQPEVRRPLMAVKPMTQQGQWVGLNVRSHTKQRLSESYI